VWSLIKSCAADRNIGFNLKIEDAWEQFQRQSGQCALTGWGLTLESIKGVNQTGEGRRTGSLDRIDSTRGYEKDNIQWVHKEINKMKGSLTTTRFCEICHAVTLRIK
jgi:hypothetical protein